MTQSTAPRYQEIHAALGGRDLVWFGTRGIDAMGLYPLAHPALVTAQIAPIPTEKLGTTLQDNLETRSRLRRDLDQYDIDRDPSLDAAGLRSEFLAGISAPVVLVAYRAAELLCRPSFCHPELVTAAPFFLMQRQFEHKPWVEQQLLKVDGVRMLRSTFIRDDDVASVAAMLRNGPLVGRCSTGAGGAGVFSFVSEEEYFERLPNHQDGFVGLTPLLDRALPLNINACVYSSGEVAAFGVSFQLIGIRGLTRRGFGFCGNDFLAASALPDEAFRQIETSTRAIGQWLHRYGYCGVFGLDMLWDDGTLYVNEINPRFQASTPLSASINQALDLSDPMIEHVATFLGLGAPAMPSIAEQTRAHAGLRGATALTQVIHRNISTARLRSAGRNGAIPPGVEIVGAPENGIYVEREAMLFKSMHADGVTSDGHTVTPNVYAAAKAIKVAAY